MFATSCQPVHCQNIRNLLESYVAEIFVLRRENEYLKKEIIHQKFLRKKCFNCGMEGHIARACCRPSRTDVNWRTGLVNASCGSGNNTSQWTPDTPEASLVQVKEPTSNAVAPSNESYEQLISEGDVSAEPDEQLEVCEQDQHIEHRSCYKEVGEVRTMLHRWIKVASDELNKEIEHYSKDSSDSETEYSSREMSDVDEELNAHRKCAQHKEFGHSTAFWSAELGHPS